MSNSKKKAKKAASVGGFTGGKVTIKLVDELKYNPPKTISSTSADVYDPPDGSGGSARPIDKLVLEEDDEDGVHVLFAQSPCGDWAYAAVGDAQIEQIAQYLVNHLGKAVTPQLPKSK